MGDNFKKVQAGDKLTIPAETFNTLIDVARDFRARQLGNSSGATPGPQLPWVLIKNTSGGDRNRFDVLGIDGPLFTPTDNLDGFKNRIVLSGATPTLGSHWQRFAILLEPVASGQVGRACVSGVCVARVNVVDEGHAFADVEDSEPDHLKSGLVGWAQILWKEAGTGVKWAVVRIGGRDGVIPGKVTAVEQHDGPPSAHLYKVESLDGTFALDTFTAPANANERPIGLTSMPAAVDDLCLIWRNGDETAIEVWEKSPTCVQDDDIWIEAIEVAHGSHQDLKISHIGPGPADHDIIANWAGGSDWITVTVTVDAKGHVLGVAVTAAICH